MLRNQSLAGFLGLLFTGLSSAAPLQNGDFSSFEGWNGERLDGSPSTISGTDLDDNAVDTDDNFRRDATAGTGTAANSDTYWSLDLFQDFTVPDAEGGTIWLSFDYSWSMTDWQTDLMSIFLDTGATSDYLVGPSFPQLVPPLVEVDSNSGSGSLSYDVTEYSTQNVIFSAVIQDNDYNVQDSVTIGNIALSVTPNQVPVPPTVLLLLAGFPLILHWGVRNKG